MCVGSVLSGGEYYTDEDASQEDWSPAHDLKMKSFAWPLLLQAAKLVELSGSKLRLTPAGRKANQAIGLDRADGYCAAARGGG